jgi:branched-chain amino acid transport system permease protein
MSWPARAGHRSPRGAPGCHGGVNIRLLYTVVFGFGAALAGWAWLADPQRAAGHGQLIRSVFVVIVIGGIGSIRGALVSAIIVGVVDTSAAPFAAAAADLAPGRNPPGPRSPMLIYR